MEVAREIDDYLPQVYPSTSEVEYVSFLWDSFESNYTSNKFQFAMLAFHMLYMSYVYFSVWKIKRSLPNDFAKSLIFFRKEEELGLLNASSPFAFSEVNERSIFKFLRLAGCENQHIGKFQKLVDQRNEIAHPNGNIYFSDQDTTDQKLQEILQQIGDIQTHMGPVLEGCLKQFLYESANPDEREIADAKDQVETNFLHKYYISRKDIKAFLNSDLSEFATHPHKANIEELLQILKQKAEE